MVVRQYPYILEVYLVPDSFQDESGNFHNESNYEEPGFQVQLEGTQLAVEGLKEILEEFKLSLENEQLWIESSPENIEKFEFEIDGTGLFANQIETSNWHPVSRCRDEAGNGKKVTLTDNSVHEYAFLVQLPKNTPALPLGTRIRVRHGDVVRCEGEVIYSRKDQLHTRIWV